MDSSVTPDRSEARGRRDFQDQSAISSGTQKTILDSTGSWTPMLSTEGEWTSGQHFATDKVSETSIELVVGLQCRRDRLRQLDSEALPLFLRTA